MVKSELPTSKGMKFESYFAFASPKPVGVSVAESEGFTYQPLAGAEDGAGLETEIMPVVLGSRSVLSRQVVPVVTPNDAAGIVGFALSGSSTDFAIRTVRSSVITP